MERILMTLKSIGLGLLMISVVTAAIPVIVLVEAALVIVATASAWIAGLALVGMRTLEDLSSVWGEPWSI